MKYLNLVWRNLLRRKVRTLFTLLSICVAFVLFAYLGAINAAFTLGVDVVGEDRLLTSHRTSLVMPLPLSHQKQIAAVPGVQAVAHATWFGGKYQNEPEGRFGIFPVVPEEYMPLFPELVLPADQMQCWTTTRTGVVVGRKVAADFDWKIGDRIPIQGTIFRKLDGGDLWEFDVCGIYEGREPGVDESMFLVRYDYFDEAREIGKGMVGWYSVQVRDPQNAAAVVAEVDARFANSFYETKTDSEKAFVQGFANQIGNIGKILQLVLTAVFFTILLVAGNTVAQSVRERTGELAVLKTLGFSDSGVLAMVLAESLLLAGVGGGLGLGLGWLLIQAGDPTGGRLPTFYLPTRNLVAGAGFVVALGLAAGALPGVQALRLRIVDALRRS